MYNGRTSERQLKKEQEKLKNQKIALENQEMIKRYLGWLMLPYSEKEKIRKEWEEYYNKVPKTKAAKEYFELKKNWPPSSKKAKTLINNARQKLEDKEWELAMPQSTDPSKFYTGVCSKYQSICSQINFISKKLTGIGVENVKEIFKPTPQPEKKEVKVKKQSLPYRE